MPEPRPLLASELEPLAIGAWILGAGGGGDPYHAYLNLRRLYAEGVTVSLLDPDELDDDANIAVVSTMGSPLVGEERLTDPEVAALAVRQMEEHLGCRFDAVMSLEIGGSNSFQPLMVAAVMGLPVLDADSMGRAYPEATPSSSRRWRVGSGWSGSAGRCAPRWARSPPPARRRARAGK
jgi:hypothetical protein